MKSNPILFFASCAVVGLLTGCAGMRNYGQGGSHYNDNSGGYGYYDRYDDQYDSQRYHLQRERERLREERERLEEERRRRHDDDNSYGQGGHGHGHGGGGSPWLPSPPPPPPLPERCPPGYSPSERKCSHEERKRGCSDMRLPGGLGCVRR